MQRAKARKQCRSFGTHNGMRVELAIERRKEQRCRLPHVHARIARLANRSGGLRCSKQNEGER